MLGFKLTAPQRENSVEGKTRPIYLDMQVRKFTPRMSSISPLNCFYKATTPVDPRVLDAMLPYLTDQYGNPHSRTHAYGWEAEEAVEAARKVCGWVFLRFSCLMFLFQHVADLIGADPKDIIFTSGATESNNLSIKGVARFHKEKKRHVITTQTVCPNFSSVYPFPYWSGRNINVYSTRAENLAKRDLILRTSRSNKTASSTSKNLRQPSDLTLRW